MKVQDTVVRGLVAGLAGVAAMTAAEKLEQRLTRRPNSYVPAQTLERLLGLPRRPDGRRLGLNWAMHWGQGIVLGPVRALMAERGVRGPVGSFLFLNLRLLNDQTLENATGVGAPPWTWPADEQTVDCCIKRSTPLPQGWSQTGSRRGRCVLPCRAGVGRPASAPSHHGTCDGLLGLLERPRSRNVSVPCADKSGAPRAVALEPPCRPLPHLSLMLH